VPGFTDYLQLLDATHLLGIGMSPVSDGNMNWGLVVSLFDISDLNNPILVNRYQVSANGGSWSTATYDYHAITYYSASQVLALPVSSQEWIPAPDGGMGGQWNYQTDEMVFHLDDTGGLQLDGQVSDGSEIQRGVFIGNLLYAVSNASVTVHSLDDLTTLVAQVPLPPPENGSWWPIWWGWWGEPGVLHPLSVTVIDAARGGTVVWGGAAQTPTNPPVNRPTAFVGPVSASGPGGTSGPATFVGPTPAATAPTVVPIPALEEIANPITVFIPLGTIAPTGQTSPVSTPVQAFQVSSLASQSTAGLAPVVQVHTDLQGATGGQLIGGVQEAPAVIPSSPDDNSETQVEGQGTLESRRAGSWREFLMEDVEESAALDAWASGEATPPVQACDAVFTSLAGVDALPLWTLTATMLALGDVAQAQANGKAGKAHQPRRSRASC
jgi:hypothetical protein